MNTVLLSFSVAWIVLNIIGNYFLFKKAGKPGWHSLIPFLNTYDEFDMCWDGKKGILYGLFLFFFNGIGKMILGLGNSQYLGKLSYSGRSLRREGQMVA